MGKRWTMRTFAVILTALFLVLLLTGCEKKARTAYTGGVLREESDSPWTKEAARFFLEDAGKPKGTEREVFSTSGKQALEATFYLRKPLTQDVFDGYAQWLWRASEKAAAMSNRSGSGDVYYDMEEARRRQEPFDYYIWYYYIGEQRYRIGIYSTEMEQGTEGGMVVKLEKDSSS